MPPIVYEKTDKQLCVNSSKEVQNVLNHFWKRLLKAYLPTLDRRQKWNKATPSLKVNDIVWLLKHVTSRGIFPLGKITATHCGKDGVTRVCTVETAYRTFERPAVPLSPVFARNVSLEQNAQSFFYYKSPCPFLLPAARGGGWSLS